MPAIFLSSIQIEDTVNSPVWNKKILGACLLLLFIPLLFINWKQEEVKIVNLPSKYASFTGRGKELISLKQRLLTKQKERAINLVALCGEGGLGKTELAIAFANLHLTDFSFIGWIDGSSEEAMVHSYARLGDILDIREELPEKRREKVHFALENQKEKPWLLIFDDLREIPSDLPKAGGAVLITCRDRGICEPQDVIELSKDQEEAIVLLSKLTGKQRSEALEHLAKQLDYLPLMINLAGHYIAETPGIELSHYSTLVSEEVENGPLKWTEFRKRYPSSLAATYLTTLKLLASKHPLSVEFLKDAIFLNPGNISEELIIGWLEKKKIYSQAQIPIVKGDILRELINHSLIRYDASRAEFSIHQLLYQTLLLERDGEYDWTDILMHLGAVKQFNPTQKDSIRPFQKLLPHCLKALEQSHSIPLTLNVARYFLDTEVDLEKGKIYLGKSEEWSQGWSHPIRGRIAFLQGMLKYREAEFERALSYFDRALKIFEEQKDDQLYLGLEQNPKKCTKEYQRAISMQYQGQILRELGRLDEAEKRLEEALSALRAIAEEHFDIARILREQALIQWARGEQDEAIAKVEEAIKMQQRVYGDIYHFQPAVAAMHRTLGNFLFEKGQYLKAEQAYQVAIDVNLAIYQTEDHPFQVELRQLIADAQNALRK